MATPTADTSEIRRKGRQRLIGAITIVLLLVVFVPMLLDPEPGKDKDKSQPTLAIPSKEGAPALPAPAAPAKAALPPIEAKPSLSDTTKSSVPPKAPEAAKIEAAKVAEPPKAEPAKVAEPKKATEAPKAAEPAKPAPKLEGFAIQVGAFADEEKLRVAREKLGAARIPHFTERLPNGLTRVRAGPYKTREEAEKATAGLKAAGLDGKVVPLP